MLTIYRTDDCVIHELDEFQEGAWINLVNPTMEESQEVAENFEIDIADIRAALDEEESSRIDLEDGYTLILVDIPTTEIRHESKNLYHDPSGHHPDYGQSDHHMYRGDPPFSSILYSGE